MHFSQLWTHIGQIQAKQAIEIGEAQPNENWQLKGFYCLRIQ
jgi:hypothetical protein